MISNDEPEKPDDGIPYVDYLPDEGDEVQKTCEFIARYYKIPISHVRMIDVYWHDGETWHEWGRFEIMHWGAWQPANLPDECYR